MLFRSNGITAAAVSSEPARRQTRRPLLLSSSATHPHPTPPHPAAPSSLPPKPQNPPPAPTQPNPARHTHARQQGGVDGEDEDDDAAPPRAPRGPSMSRKGDRADKKPHNPRSPRGVGGDREGGGRQQRRADGGMRIVVPLQGVVQGRGGLVLGSLIPCALFYFLQLYIKRNRPPPGSPTDRKSVV